MLKRKLVSIILLVSVIVLTFASLPVTTFAQSKKVNESVPVEGKEGVFNLVSQTLDETVFTIEEEGKLYEYHSNVLNSGKTDEKIRVERYLVKKNKKKKLVESSEVLVSEVANQVNSPQLRASCSGKTDAVVSWKGTRMSLYFNSCLSKKIVDVINDSSGATGGIAAIGAVLRSVSKVAPYVGALAGVIWFAGFTIKQITANGKYGFGYHMGRNPITGKLLSPIGVPWRQ